VNDRRKPTKPARKTPARLPSPTPSAPPSPRETFLREGLRLVHEDNDIIVVDKPAGLLTVSLEEENRENVFAIIKRHVREQVKRRGTKVWVIHRLDKEASGLLVFAKSEPSFKWLKEDLRARRVRRIYFAVLEGELAGKQVGDIDVVQSFLEEDENGVMRTVPTAVIARSRRKPDDDSAMEAKMAVTHYRVRAIGNGRTLVELKLDTGRKNQIRAHMAHLGHPIVGDRRYGAKDDPISRVCLHAAELGLTDARTGRPLNLFSELPAPFLKLVALKSLPAPTDPSAPRPAPTPPPPPSRDHSQNPDNPAPNEAGWDHVAEWYDQLVDQRRSDHHDNLLIPGALKLLHATRGMRVLDVACGQGVLCHALSREGVSVIGVDASPRLIAAAKKSAPANAEFHVGDARNLTASQLGEFDRVSCIMALMNIEPLAPVMRGIRDSLKVGGKFVAIMLHPAFRAPGQTSWGWAPIDAPKESESGGPRARYQQPQQRDQEVRQYRRVDGYLSPGQSPIIMNPGKASKGAERVVTWTYHRPLQTYARALAEAGLLIDCIEEWPSLRSSEPGPRAAEENRARREIPMFLALRAVRNA